MILTRFSCSVGVMVTFPKRCYRCRTLLDIEWSWWGMTKVFIYLNVFFFLITPGIKHAAALVRDEPSVCPTFLLFLQQHSHDARVAVIRLALPSRRVISTSEVWCQLLLLSVWYPSVTLKGSERCLPDDIFCPPPTPPPSSVHFQFV